MTAAALPCNAWLFLLRVRAMPYHAWRRATLVICTSLWLTTFTSLLILPSLKVDTIRLTSDRCIYTTTADIRLLGIPFIALSIFDTAVAITTLLGMTRHHPNGSLPARVKSTILMQNMGPLCRAFIQTGYMYYLFVQILSAQWCLKPVAHIFIQRHDLYSPHSCFLDPLFFRLATFSYLSGRHQRGVP